MEIDIIKAKRNILLEHITFLSINEYSDFKKDIPVCNDDWWLRDPAELCGKVSFVNGKSGCCSLEKLRREGQVERGIRPVLRIQSEKSGLLIGDKFVLDNRLWTVITKEYAMCDVIIGKCTFINAKKMLVEWFEGLKKNDGAIEADTKRILRLSNEIREGYDVFDMLDKEFSKDIIAAIKAVEHVSNDVKENNSIISNVIEGLRMIVKQLIAIKEEEKHNYVTYYLRLDEIEKRIEELS